MFDHKIRDIEIFSDRFVDFFYRVKKEIRHLECEVSKWQVLADKVRGDVPADFDNQTLAVLRGRLVRYLMRSKEVVRNYDLLLFHILIQ